MTSPNSVFVAWLRGASLLLVLGFTPAALAQRGGLGPDPYRPFNQQYDAFVYPQAPGFGDVLPSEAALSGGGLSRNNQFQDYLRGNGSGTGGSSYRSQRQMDPQAFRDSQYQPNRTVDQDSGFYEKQDFVSQAYFAYLREKDPKKRADLLKEYQRARSKPATDFSTSSARRKSPRKKGEAASLTSSRTEKPAPSRSRLSAAESSENLPKVPSRSRTVDSRANSRQTPALPRDTNPTGSGKPSSSRPSDVLEESLRRERELKSSPSGRARSTAPSRARSTEKLPSAPPLRGTSSPSSPE